MYGGRGAPAGATGQVGRYQKTGSSDTHNFGTLQQFTPEQMQLFQQMFGQVGPESFLGKLAGGDESTFAQMEAPAMRQFAGLQGNLASRFSGMGTGGRKSSGFQNTANQASSEFAQGLQSQRQGLQRQALTDMMGISQNLLGQRPFENISTEKQQKPSFLQSIMGGAGDILGQGGMMGLMKLLGMF